MKDFLDGIGGLLILLALISFFGGGNIGAGLIFSCAGIVVFWIASEIKPKWKYKGTTHHFERKR